MAYASVTFTPQFNLFTAVVKGRTSLVRAIKQYNTYRTTKNELMALSAHSLADLGMNYSMIKSVALEAAYGPQA